MLHGATQVLFEGVPTHPDAGRAWDIVDKYKVRCCGQNSMGLSHHRASRLYKARCGCCNLHGLLSALFHLRACALLVAPAGSSQNLSWYMPSGLSFVLG